MKLNKWYDFYFKNQGRCPECGMWLVPHIGCLGWVINKSDKQCSINALSKKSLKGKYLYVNLVRALRKKLSYKNGKNTRNLDIQREKTYFKIDD